MRQDYWELENTFGLVHSNFVLESNVSKSNTLQGLNFLIRG